MAGQRKERNELIKLIETYHEYQPQAGIRKDSKGAFIKLFGTGDGTDKDQREGGAQIEYRDEASITPARSVGGGVSNAAIASGAPCPYSGSPVVDMIEHIERTRAGWSIAICWTIMPPIEAPAMWAAPTSLVATWRRKTLLL